ncbi:Nudix family hydrolase [Uliginosibacterium sp. H3]|uniref:8-oxo-dGTP diphosphatase n=1 Tax=Uliginosibacterium silvisoli TaxID=3114758 RepID=A0ABU6JXY7_9RHOO|nr:Nudix family hydrolase [Uliginosibacterium sp. H3]
MVKQVAVAAAVITRPDGSFLLGQRAADTVYSGYWEFPGGKVEAGETPRDALVRELSEELGIVVDLACPWLMREHVYEHAHVRLHFFEVPQWHGELQPNVHAAMTWQQADQLDVGPMLPANGPILKALRLPRVMALTHAFEIGVDAQLAALDQALAAGLKCVQVREPGMPPDARDAFAQAVLARCKEHGALVLLNGDAARAADLGMDGVHLSAQQLLALHERPKLEWVGASCHNRAELEHAAKLELDYAVLGAVKPTASHPGQPAIGWQTFHDLTRELSIPVLAIGGLAPHDLSEAKQAGAHGIACIRAAWGSGA